MDSDERQFRRVPCLRDGHGAAEDARVQNCFGKKERCRSILQCVLKLQAFLYFKPWPAETVACLALD